jgi:hypothetical protein
MNIRIIFVLLVVVGCRSRGPVIDVGLSKPSSGGVHFVGKDGQFYFLTYANTDKYIVVPPADFFTLMNACAIREPIPRLTSPPGGPARETRQAGVKK